MMWCAWNDAKTDKIQSHTKRFVTLCTYIIVRWFWCGKAISAEWWECIVILLSVDNDSTCKSKAFLKGFC